MRSRSKPWLGAVALVLLSGGAWAGESADGSEELGAPIAQQTLDQQRGTGGLEINIQEQNAVQEQNAGVTGNKVFYNENGSNFIKDDAFRNASGLLIPVQNTGHNNSIQIGVILQLDLR